MISIIVPVYNAEKYLRQCLNSILNQTYKDFELILVDDGSNDKSYSICEEYSRADFRVKCIRKDNGGVSSARNVGLKNAKGEWIYFCDADDRLADDNGLQNLIVLVDNSQLVVCGYKEIDEQGKKLQCNNERLQFKDIISKKSFVSYFFDEKGTVGYQGYLWTKLFNREIIEKNHLRFDENIKFAEDMLFVTEYCCCKEVQTIRIDNTIKVYDYIHHRGSAMDSLKESYNPNFFTDFLAFEKIYHRVQATFNDKKLDKLFLHRLFVSGFWILDLMNQFGVDYKEQREYIERVMSEHPRLKDEFETGRSMSVMIEKAKKLPMNKRIDIVNDWLHSKDCHFSALSMNWKTAYVLSMLGGETGMKLIKSKLNFQ